MKYPKLVPKAICTTKVEVIIEREGVSEDGAPEDAFEGELKCNYQERARKVFTEQQKIVEVNATAYFSEDFAEDVPTLASGSVVVHGVTRRIVEGIRARNPDGTVNYIELRLM